MDLSDMQRAREFWGDGLRGHLEDLNTGATRIGDEDAVLKIDADAGWRGQARAGKVGTAQSFNQFAVLFIDADGEIFQMACVDMASIIQREADWYLNRGDPQRTYRKFIAELAVEIEHQYPGVKCV